MNRVTLIGNLGKKPDLRQTGSGKAVCSFSMATTKSFKKQGSNEWDKTTTWWNVVLWGKDAESAAKLLDKGSQVFVEGEGRTNKYTDAKGVDRTTLEIHAETFKLLARVDRAPSQDQDQDQDSNTGGVMHDLGDDD
jgi:single-strand DNA-binding protein